MEKTYLTHLEVADRARNIAELIVMTDIHNIKLYGIPRGGVAPTYLVCSALEQVFHRQVYIVDKPEDANVFIDDIIDTGATKERYYNKYPGAYFYALVVPALEAGEKTWYVFPWELKEDGGDESATDIPIRLLEYIGENPDRGGLQETPKRFLKAWDVWSSGYGVEPKEILKVFKDGAEKCDELVLVRDIPVYSHCEHHLAPFFGVAHVAYIPNGSIVGLSKLSRLVDVFARRLQVQERLTNEIADALTEALAPLGVAVVVECRHLCMESRGIQRQGSATITSAMRGAFKEKPETRAEFFGLVKK